MYSCLASSPRPGLGHLVWMAGDGQQVSASPYSQTQGEQILALGVPSHLADVCFLVPGQVPASGHLPWQSPGLGSCSGAISLSSDNVKSCEGWNFHIAQKAGLPNHSLQRKQKRTKPLSEPFSISRDCKGRG